MADGSTNAPTGAQLQAQLNAWKLPIIQSLMAPLQALATAAQAAQAQIAGLGADDDVSFIVNVASLCSSYLVTGQTRVTALTSPPATPSQPTS